MLQRKHLRGLDRMPASTTSPERPVSERELCIATFLLGMHLSRRSIGLRWKSWLRPKEGLLRRMSPIEALRAWMLLFVDYIATKKIIASALNAYVGGPSKLYERFTRSGPGSD